MRSDYSSLELSARNSDAGTNRSFEALAMVMAETFSRLVSGIYAAAVTPDHWAAALGDIRRTFDGTAGGLFMADSAVWSVLDSTLPADFAKSYADYYHRSDHVLAAVGRGPAGAVRTGAELMPLVRESEFHQEWLHPLGIDDGLFVRLTGGPRPTCLMLGAARRTESFDAPDRTRLMRGLVPHLQQALRTQKMLGALTDSTAELVGAMEAVRHGMTIVSEEHVVIHLNLGAELIFRAEDGLRLNSGRIAATNTNAERELHLAIRNAIDGGGSSTPGGRTLICVRPSGKRSYVIHVLPSSRRSADKPPWQPMAVVVIVDPEDESEPTAALLRRLYHLTEAEAEVALHVMHGADPKHVADQLSVSLTTVRTHLHHVFDKTDTHRQAELVRLLLSLSR